MDPKLLKESERQRRCRREGAILDNQKVLGQNNYRVIYVELMIWCGILQRLHKYIFMHINPVF